MKIKPSTLIIIIASVLVVAVGITLAVVLTREEPAPVEPIEPVDPDAVIGTLIYHLHGEATHTVKVTKGEPFEFYTPDPRYGYTFVGWALEGEYNRAITKEYVENFDFESILRLYAIWNANDAITITFNSMGGSVVANHSHLKGDPLGLLLENSTRDGYTFMGWYEDETCNIPYNRDVARTADITLYAKWLKIEITDETVTVHFSNTGDSAPAPVTLRLGATFSDPLPAVQQLGYIFAGWYLDTGYTMPFNITTPITTNMTLFARWTKTQNQYVLTFDTQGGTPVPPISNTEVFYVEALELPTTSRDGYIFLGWYRDIYLNEKVESNFWLIEDCTLYAGFRAIEPIIDTYTVSFYPYYGYSHPAADTEWTFSVDAGGTAVAPIGTFFEGYTFTGWYADESHLIPFDFSTPIHANTPIYGGWEVISMHADELVTYTLSVDGTHYTVSGYTPAADHADCVVNLPADIEGIPVTAIDEYVFMGKYLHSITLGEGIVSIGKQSFYQVEGLSAITIGAGVQAIGDEAFAESSIVTLSIPFVVGESACTIAEGAFRACASLTEADIGNVSVIGPRAFADCSYLGSVTLYKLTSMEHEAFCDCTSLSTVDLSATSLQAIPYRAFEGCGSLTSILFPTALREIGSRAFAESGIVTINMNDFLLVPTSALELDIFLDAPVAKMEIGTYTDVEVVTSILESVRRKKAGESDKKITVTVDSANTAFAVENGELYSKDMTVLYLASVNGSTYTVREGVTTIARGAFAHNSTLSTIVLPTSCTTLAQAAFYNLSALALVQFPGGVTVEEYAFYACNTKGTIVIRTNSTAAFASGYSAASGAITILREE